MLPRLSLSKFLFSQERTILPQDVDTIGVHGTLQKAECRTGTNHNDRRFTQSKQMREGYRVEARVHGKIRLNPFGVTMWPIPEGQKRSRKRCSFEVGFEGGERGRIVHMLGAAVPGVEQWPNTDVFNKA